MWPCWPCLIDHCCPAQAVGGNAALALLLTVGTNLAGIFTMPFALCWLLDTGSSAVALAPGPLLRSLMKTILLPLLVGAGSRALVPGVHCCLLPESFTLPTPIMSTAAHWAVALLWLSCVSLCRRSLSRTFVMPLQTGPGS